MTNDLQQAWIRFKQANTPELIDAAMADMDAVITSATIAERLAAAMERADKAKIGHFDTPIRTGELRDRIRDAIAADPDAKYCVESDQAGYREISEHGIDRIADIAAQVAGPTAAPSLFSEMASVADKLNKLKYWSLDSWQFTGYRFESGGSQSSIENACVAVSAAPRPAVAPVGLDREKLLQYMNRAPNYYSTAISGITAGDFDSTPQSAQVSAVKNLKAVAFDFFAADAYDDGYSVLYKNLRTAIEALAPDSGSEDGARLNWLEENLLTYADVKRDRLASTRNGGTIMEPDCPKCGKRYRTVLMVESQDERQLRDALRSAMAQSEASAPDAVKEFSDWLQWIIDSRARTSRPIAFIRVTEVQAEFRKRFIDD